MSNRDMRESAYPIATQRRVVVRQDRMSVAGESCFLECLGRKLEVLDVSSFGLAVVSEDSLEQLNDILGVKLSFENQEIGAFHLKRVRSEPTEAGQYKIAFECLGEPIPVDRMKGIRLAKGAVYEHKLEVDHTSEVPEAFKRVVYEMKDWLLSLKVRVNALTNNFSKLSPREAEDFERAISNIVGNYIVSEMGPTYKHLERSLGKPTPELTKKSFDFFRSKLNEILQAAPFSRRANEKPLGYAGDYQMMNYIYAQDPAGDDLFAKCLHLYFISAPESRAVKNRAGYLGEKLVSKIKSREGAETHVLAVASGPAFEVQTLIRRYVREIDFSNTHFHLLDQDVESLQFAQRELRAVGRETGLKLNVNLVNQNIKTLITRGLGNQSYDLIYSAGLFDYFSDPVATIVAQKLFGHLNSNGDLIIGNFSVSSPGQITMDVALDWHLIYRSEEDLKRLYSHIAPQLSIEKEAEGINLFCILSNLR